MKSIVLAAATLLALSGAALSAEEVTECDRLAAHGSDPERIAPAVSESGMNKAAAQAACEAAAAEDPNNRRVRYQLGRAYFYDGKFDKAMPHLEFAAAAGSPQAQFVLGYIIDTAQGGVAKDPCKVEDLWVKSARQGRLAAQISYPHHVMRGLFKGCTQQAATDEIEGFLAAAKKQASDYYERLLVSIMLEELTAHKAKK
jgi:tetratricopeptide (TPR) repeat protein